MSASQTLEPFRTKAWPAQALGAIRTMRERAPRLPLEVFPRGVPVGVRGCWTARELDVVARTFHFRGKGRDQLVVVRLQRIAFVHLLRAMLDEPGIQIGFGAGTTASYRTEAAQAALYAAYLDDGPLAAPPCSSFHNKALSADTYYLTPVQRGAMLEHGFYDLLPQDPPHFTYGTRG